jgi:hypothetical protein
VGDCVEAFGYVPFDVSGSDPEFVMDIF